jgi:hypothetical protein
VGSGKTLRLISKHVDANPLLVVWFSALIVLAACQLTGRLGVCQGMHGHLLHCGVTAALPENN